ncbi:MAG: hypothetical protein EOL87_03965 [Spartobacteria bacterium]|nr:hypothetical protein [Spartobacteria bacterium]
MKYVSCLLLLLIGLVSGGCFRKDVQTYVIDVPGMKTKDCALYIEQALRAPEAGNVAIEGIVHVQMVVTNHQVFVTYDSTKIARKNLEYLICAAGFEANGNPPKPGTREKLPDGCR